MLQLPACNGGWGAGNNGKDMEGDMMERVTMKKAGTCRGWLWLLRFVVCSMMVAIAMDAVLHRRGACREWLQES